MAPPSARPRHPSARTDPEGNSAKTRRDERERARGEGERLSVHDHRAQGPHVGGLERGGAEEELGPPTHGRGRTLKVREDRGLVDVLGRELVKRTMEDALGALEIDEQPREKLRPGEPVVIREHGGEGPRVLAERAALRRAEARLREAHVARLPRARRHVHGDVREDVEDDLGPRAMDDGARHGAGRKA
jgi:hypothetical protein